MRSATRKKTGKDKAYLAWLHKIPCIVCVGWERVQRLIAGTQTWGDVADMQANLRGVPEAAHVGERGLSQKCPDREAIPLCGFHHRTGPHSSHVLGKKFWTLHALDKDAIIARLNAEYERLNG